MRSSEFRWKRWVAGVVGLVALYPAAGFLLVPVLVEDPEERSWAQACADHARLRQALSNLLNNAVQHGGPAAPVGLPAH